MTVFKARALPVKPPRALFARFDRGQIFGPPGDAATQRAVVRAALELLQSPTGPLYREFAQQP
ncbi:MAG: hypothetical protein HY329_01110 [Chloroflexi bacterium]|nr:hypothetical protein [Chloroflexota bacterium]